MYCKNCGKEIPDDSNFCQHCGSNLKKEDSIIPQEEKPSDSVAKSESKARTAGIIIAVILVGLMVVMLPFLVLKCSADSRNSSSWKTTNSDITIANDTSFSLNANIIVTPKYDIKDLQITFSFYADDKKLIATKARILGNVLKGTQYSVTFAASEFSIASLMQISSYSWKVSGGTTTR